MLLFLLEYMTQGIHFDARVLLLINESWPEVFTWTDKTRPRDRIVAQAYRAIVGQLECSGKIPSLSEHTCHDKTPKHNDRNSPFSQPNSDQQQSLSQPASVSQLALGIFFFLN